MGYTVGIDIGGSTTKIVGLTGGKTVSPLMVRASDPMTSAYGAFGKFLTLNSLAISDIDKVHFTGVGSSHLTGNIYGLPTHKIDEFMAIGLGGRYLSGEQNCIVVSMGTGTAFVSVRGDGIRHLGGTGVGGGTLLGLAHKMLGISGFAALMELAGRGDLANVDLTIGDITRSQLSNMQNTTTAANFGKLSDMASPADTALGIVNLVLQTIGMLGVFAARAEGMDTAVLTGNLSKLDPAREIFDQFEALFGVKFIIPTDADFATATGAAIFKAIVCDSIQPDNKENLKYKARGGALHSPLPGVERKIKS